MICNVCYDKLSPPVQTLPACLLTIPVKEALESQVWRINVKIK